MAITILHGATATAVNAATTQTDQVAALLAQFGSGNATFKVMAGTTLLSTIVAPLGVNATTNPIQIAPGVRV